MPIPKSRSSNLMPVKSFGASYTFVFSLRLLSIRDYIPQGQLWGSEGWNNIHSSMKIKVFHNFLVLHLSIIHRKKNYGKIRKNAEGFLNILFHYLKWTYWSFDVGWHSIQQFLIIFSLFWGMKVQKNILETESERRGNSQGQK